MKKIAITIMTITSLLAPTLFADANDEIKTKFNNFISNPSEDTFNKVFTLCDNLRVRSDTPKDVRDIKDYVTKLKKINNVQITFYFFNFKDTYFDNETDNRIRIYVGGHKYDPDCKVNVGDIHESSGVLSKIHNEVIKGTLTWEQSLKDSMVLWFENFSFWWKNEQSKEFLINKYSIFVQSRKTGEVIERYEDNSGAYIELKFFGLPTLSE